MRIYGGRSSESHILLEPATRFELVTCAVRVRCYARQPLCFETLRRAANDRLVIQSRFGGGEHVLPFANANVAATIDTTPSMSSTMTKCGIRRHACSAMLRTDGLPTWTQSRFTRRFARGIPHINSSGGHVSASAGTGIPAAVALAQSRRLCGLRSR